MYLGKMRHKTKLSPNKEVNLFVIGEGLERELKKLMKQFPEIKEIRNLNDYKKKTGIYIMVLDGYNTLYIGQSTAKDLDRKLKPLIEERDKIKKDLFKVRKAIIDFENNRGKS